MIRADGGNGLPAAPNRPAIPVRRCRAYGIGNVPNKLLKPDREDAERDPHDIMNAPNPTAASPPAPIPHARRAQSGANDKRDRTTLPGSSAKDPAHGHLPGPYPHGTRPLRHPPTIGIKMTEPPPLSPRHVNPDVTHWDRLSPRRVRRPTIGRTDIFFARARRHLSRCACSPPGCAAGPPDRPSDRAYGRAVPEGRRAIPDGLRRRPGRGRMRNALPRRRPQGSAGGRRKLRPGLSPWVTSGRPDGRPAAAGRPARSFRIAGVRASFGPNRGMMRCGGASAAHHPSREAAGQ